MACRISAAWLTGGGAGGGGAMATGLAAASRVTTTVSGRCAIGVAAGVAPGTLGGATVRLGRVLGAGGGLTGPRATPVDSGRTAAGGRTASAPESAATTEPPPARARSDRR